MRAYDVLKRLAALTPAECGAECPEGEPEAIPAVRFSTPAQEVFDTWRDDLERRLRSGEQPAALTAHLAKYRSLMPSLALIFHLMVVIDAIADLDDTMNTGGPGVSLEAAQTAAAWCEYLESHAQRLYASAANPTMERARALAARIASGDVVDGCVVRDIYRKQWSRLTTPEEVDSAVKTLEAYGWVCVETVDTGGRPSNVLRVHPQMRQRKPGNI
jgi:putative DNA primase/helicase